jgi:NodT family efflux transporter outer membrane factor (OMF) lipoprotein
MHKDLAAQAVRDIHAIDGWSQLDGGQQATILDGLIRCPKLEALVSEALAANPDLQQTLFTLHIQQAEYKKTSGERLPEAEAGFTNSREEGLDPTYTGSISIGWEVDLWRKLADESRAAEKDVAEQKALYQSARDTLAAEVMKAWLELITTQKDIAIEKKRLAVLEKNETFILERYKNGLRTLEDLDSARTNTASSRASLEEYRENLAQQRRALNTLLGREAGASITLPADYPVVIIPLVDLPVQTLKRRPDLKAAYLAIEAQNLRARAAYKELLPSINMEAAFEDVADTSGSALFTDPVWSLLAQLTAPLYQGGKLRAAAEVAELEAAKAYQAYRQTLLDAVREVEDAIGQERALKKRGKHIKTALVWARNNHVQYREKYRAGLVGMLDILDVQNQTYDLEQQLNNLIHERLANRIDLGLALGLGVK